ncbi:unnamed protein product [Effrenium voratum]|nr:unnamed protein product [Effrenium voratum]
MDLILMGHSFGFALAQAVAQRLAAAGAALRGLVALDCRCLQRTALEIDVVPRRLRVDVASAFHSAALAFRSAATELRVAAALVGRGGLTGRHLARPEVLAPNAAAGAGQQSSLEVADSDHWDLPMSHVWDIAAVVQKLTRCTKRPRRSLAWKSQRCAPE